MAVITLNQIKDHLRLEQDDVSQDAHLEILNDAAEDYAEQYIGRSIPWQDSDGVEVPTPASVKAAILLLIGDLYEHREGQFVGVSSEVNPVVVNMLHFYRVGLGI